MATKDPDNELTAAQEFDEGGKTVPETELSNDVLAKLRSMPAAFTEKAAEPQWSEDEEYDAMIVEGTDVEEGEAQRQVASNLFGGGNRVMRRSGPVRTEDFNPQHLKQALDGQVASMQAKAEAQPQAPQKKELHTQDLELGNIDFGEVQQAQPQVASDPEFEVELGRTSQAQAEPAPPAAAGESNASDAAALFQPAPDMLHDEAEEEFLAQKTVASEVNVPAIFGSGAAEPAEPAFSIFQQVNDEDSEFLNEEVGTRVADVPSEVMEGAAIDDAADEVVSGEDVFEQPAQDALNMHISDNDFMRSPDSLVLEAEARYSEGSERPPSTIPVEDQQIVAEAPGQIAAGDQPQPAGDLELAEDGLELGDVVETSDAESFELAEDGLELGEVVETPEGEGFDLNEGGLELGEVVEMRDAESFDLAEKGLDLGDAVATPETGSFELAEDGLELGDAVATPEAESFDLAEEGLELGDALVTPEAESFDLAEEGLKLGDALVTPEAESFDLVQDGLELGDAVATPEAESFDLVQDGLELGDAVAMPLEAGLAHGGVAPADADEQVTGPEESIELSDDDILDDQVGSEESVDPLSLQSATLRERVGALSDVAEIKTLVMSLLKIMDKDAIPNESEEQKSHRRISFLVQFSATTAQRGDYRMATLAMQLAEPLADTHAFSDAYSQYLKQICYGFFPDPTPPLTLTIPMSELTAVFLEPVEAFLLSRIGSEASLEDISSVSGMHEGMTAFILCRLLLRNLLKFR